MISPLRRIRGFLPYVCVLFFNAFVDLGHKIVIQNTLFKVYDKADQITYAAILNAFILLPFILLLTPSGYIADKYPKHWVMRCSALLAIVITLLITFCYYQHWFWGAYGLTLVLAIQSAFYSPAKYGYIKELVGKERLSEANGVVQGSTMVAILGGIFVFSALFEWRLSGHEYQTEADIMPLIAPLGWALVAGACIEALIAFRITSTGVSRPEMRFDWSGYTRGDTLRATLKTVTQHRVIKLSVIGIGIFWSISQVMLAAFPAHAKATLGTLNALHIQAALAAAGIGIAFGSNLAGRISRGRIEMGLIPLGALGIALCLLWVPLIDSLWLHALNFACIGFLGGLFVVPLNALIQFHAREADAGRTLAANNFIQNWMMLGFLALTVFSSHLGLSASDLFTLLAVVALISALYTLYTLPQSLIHFLLSRLFALKYRMEVVGLNHLPESGPVLLLGNHVSWIDWAMVQMACPRRIRFVMERSLYERWYLKRFLDSFGVIPIAKGDYQGSIAEIQKNLKAGHMVCLFPEGAISRSGQLGVFKHGFEKAAAGLSEGHIVPFYLRGLWGDGFSRSGERLKRSQYRQQRRRDIIVAFGRPMPLNSGAAAVKQQVFELSVSAWQKHAEQLPHLGSALLHSAHRSGASVAYQGAGGRTLRRHLLSARALLLASALRQRCMGQNIGLIAPFGEDKLLAVLAVLYAGKTLVPLSPKLSAEKLQQAQRAGAFDALLCAGEITAERRAQLGPEVLAIDELAPEAQAPRVLALSLLPLTLQRLWVSDVPSAEAAAVCHVQLGEEVQLTQLSHLNVHSNLQQIAEVLNMHSDDVMLDLLPAHHPYGLSVNALLPLLELVPLVGIGDRQSPLSIAKSIARHKVSLCFATPETLQALSQTPELHSLALASLRLIIVGDGQLDASDREAFAQRFAQQPYEGFGLTQTVSAITANLPDQLDSQFWQVQVGHKAGSLGLPLPGSCCLIASDEMQPLPPEHEGWLLLRGAQVASADLNPGHRWIDMGDARWLHTGLRARLDGDGFMHLI